MMLGGTGRKGRWCVDLSQMNKQFVDGGDGEKFKEERSTGTGIENKWDGHGKRTALSAVPKIFEGT